MRPKVKKAQRDEIFERSRGRHLITVAFLKALKDNLRHKEAFRLAAKGFTNYMIEYYKLVLSSTKPGSQKRFDEFRKHCEEWAPKKEYFHIVESAPNILKVRYDRCPFSEVMAEYNLSAFSYAFCLSDPGFTKAVLPGVLFRRSHVIAKGDGYCDHTWIFGKGEKRRSGKQ